MSKTARTLRGPQGWTLTIDPAQVFPDDPGEGTPAMVNAPFGRGGGTYNCVSDCGIATGDDGHDLEVPAAVLRWLEGRECQDALRTVGFAL